MRRAAFALSLVLAARGYGAPLAAQTAPMIMRQGTPVTVKGPVDFYWSRDTSPAYPKPLAITFWANRQEAPNKTPNVVWPNSPVWTQYTSITKADCATLTEIAYTMGDPAWRKWITGWTGPAGVVHPSCGLGVVPWAGLQATGVSATGGRPVVTDKFVMPPASTIATAATNVKVVGLDYEPHERTAAEAAYLLANVSAWAHQHGFRAFLYTNPWSGALMPSQGLTAASAPGLIGNFDYVSNMVDPTPPGAVAEYTYGAAIVPPAHELVTIFLTISQSDACFLRAQWQAKHFPGFMVFNAGADPNAPANAAKLAALATGDGC